VDGKGTELAKLETQEGGAKQTSTGPQKMYVASGPIQINKADPEAHGPGVISLQSGRHRVSAHGTVPSEGAHQLEFSAGKKRLSIIGTLRGRKFEAQADRVRWDYDKSLLILEGKSVARVQQNQDKPAEELRGRKIVFWYESPDLHFGIDTPTGR
jgi:hypothetical protein